MTSINSSTTVKVKKKNKALSPAISRNSSTNSLTGLVRSGGTGGTKKGGPKSRSGAGGAGAGGAGAATRARGEAPPLRPKALATPAQCAALSLLPRSEQAERVTDLVRAAFGDRQFRDKTVVPHTASQTRDRSAAAADVATAAETLGVARVLKSYGVLGEIERTLIPNGIGAIFAGNEQQAQGQGGGMTRIVSSASLASLASVGSDLSGGTGLTSEGGAANDGRKSAPANAREGALLILRALCETVGRRAEPYVVPLLAAVLDEGGSSHGAVRDAADDTARAMVKLANPHAVPVLICPVLFEALRSPEWRVKHGALERLSQLATVAPAQVSRLLPRIIPIVTSEVWDTKPQVSRAAASCLLATCSTNSNPDVAPAVPAVVRAIAKPSETVTAIEKLMGTTFVATVDASTLSILCPVLSRGLKEKVARHKRSCCVVIENMSRLVETPDAVAPFGPLLVPELRRVAENVQFDEIRDAALAALHALTKALGHSSVEDAVAAVAAEESRLVEEEQRRIEEARVAEAAREEESRRKEEEERRLWKEAMEAQRLLDQIAEKEEEEKKAEEVKRREKSKKSTKGAGGKCKACGLKKCRKDCLFAN